MIGNGEGAKLLGIGENELFDLKREAQIKTDQDRDAQLNVPTYLRKVTVVSYDQTTGKASVIYGSDTARQVDGVLSIDSYLPVVNDEVIALQNGTNLVLLGRLTSALSGLFHAKCSRSTLQSITNITETAVTFDTEVLDTDGMFTASDTRLYCRRTGWFAAKAGGIWVSNVTGTRILTIYHVAFGSGTKTAIARVEHLANTAAGRPTVMNVGGEFNFTNAGDALECWVYQSSGSNLDWSGVGFMPNWMLLRYLHP